ncbi:MAG: Gfo/Idh/MocA family oxidoreductase [Planctomycetota bacterium]
MTDRPPAPPPASPPTPPPAPHIDTRQALALTDDTGILQHGKFGVPDPNHGYCIDDNARALIAALWERDRLGDQTTLPMERYLTFLGYAFNEDAGRFRNFMGYDRRWLEAVGSEDSQGRTVWALGTAMELGPTRHVRALAGELVGKALPALSSLGSLRAWAFVLLGLDAVLRVEPGHEPAMALRADLASRLHGYFKGHATDDWVWWEDTVTYDNARMPQALIVTGDALEDGAMLRDGLRALRWVLDRQTVLDDAGSPRLSVIGNDGWFTRGGERAAFDQQPLEASGLVEALLDAASATGDAWWGDAAAWCHGWFTGCNDLRVSLIDAETGGCRDGLHADGVNQNQGAESVLAYVMSGLARARHASASPVRAGVSNRSVGLGVIGASGFAEFCLESWGSSGVEPVAVWSRSVGSAECLAEQHHGLAVHETLDALLADASVELVHVATTPATHAELVCQALDAGKHVLVEKPIATSVADAERMIAAAEKNGSVLGVNQMMRYGPLFEPVRELCGSDCMGAFLRGIVTNRAGSGGLSDDHWFWDKQQSGGIFVEHAVHFFDLIHGWLGKTEDAEVLHAYELTRPGTDLVDQAGCTIRLGEQATVDHYHGFTQSSYTDQQDIRLIFEHGQVVLSGWVASSIRLEAAVDDETAEWLADTWGPFATTDFRQRVITDADERTVAQRGSTRPVHRIVELDWSDPRDKQVIYADALRGLMNDLLHAIADPIHTMRVTAQDGLAALRLAERATQRATQREGVSW